MSLTEKLLKEQKKQLREQDQQLERLDRSGIKPLKANLNLISAEVEYQNNILDDLESNVER